MNTLVKSFKPLSGYAPLFNNIFSDFDDSLSRITLPAVNVVETTDEFKIELAAPGMKKDAFKINADGNRLTVSSESSDSKEEEKESYARREFNYSSFERSFHLPKSVDVDKIEASYEDGVLHLKLPKKEEAKPKEPRLITVG